MARHSYWKIDQTRVYQTPPDKEEREVMKEKLQRLERATQKKSLDGQ